MSIVYPWTPQFTKNFLPYIGEFKDIPTRYMEIGVFLGDTSKWMLDNVLLHRESSMIGIDPWKYESSPENMFPRTEVGKQQWNYAMDQLEKIRIDYDPKVQLVKGNSEDVLPRLHDQKNSIDILYIDGNHCSLSVLRDYILSWPLVKIGGLIIFDDYGSHLTDAKVAIDFVLKVMQVNKSPRSRKYELLFKNYQVGIRKVLE